MATITPNTVPFTAVCPRSSIAGPDPPAANFWAIFAASFAVLCSWRLSYSL
jgi:hypothetical protein